MKLVTVLFIVLNVFIISCSADKGGFAPSGDSANGNPPAAGVVVSDENHIKNAETITSLNNWQATLDITDPVENVTTANSWQVEVTYE